MRKRKRKAPAFLAVSVVVVVIAAAVITLVKSMEEPREAFLRVNPYNRAVVIDAGHGGVDGGATSLSGILESGINLEIAKKTDALMRFYGIETVMVRTEDISIHDSSASTIAQKKRSDLNNRVKLVNGTPNAVLLSIHQNSFTEPQYFGAQAFYNNDNDAVGFALKLQEQFLKLDPDNTRLAKPVADGVFLMNNVKCPAVLAECGFLTNSVDEKKLTESGYQTKLAMTLLSAYTLWEN